MLSNSRVVEIEWGACDPGGIPLVDTRARFLRSSKVGDIVQITSTVTAFRRSSFDVRHELTSDGVLAAEGFETRVWVGCDPQHPDQLKSKAIPAVVIDRFTAAAPEG